MSAINDGGPVFPIFPPAERDTVELGMSLRDWFAGQAIEEMIRLSMRRDGGWDDSDVAAGCYQLADAMLAERAKGGAE